MNKDELRIRIIPEDGQILIETYTDGIRGYTSPATPRRSVPISPRGRSRVTLRAILQTMRSLCVSAA